MRSQHLYPDIAPALIECVCQKERGLLRFLTCGSVDHGKSTLIGRLLYDSRLVLDDQLDQLRTDSRKYGSTEDELDLALLVDGLTAEREQGITIDVAYRFFATGRRHFIVADTPGHEQYTRNMVTGASTADAAVILVDARKGVQTQTRRHAFLISLLGIRHIALAVNKMDLVDFAQEVFERIEAEFRVFAQSLGALHVAAMPLSALSGDNVAAASSRMPWYRGPTLIRYLEELDTGENILVAPFRMPVQWVNRPHGDFRGYSGLIASGEVQPGVMIRVLPSGRETRVARIVTWDGDLEVAGAGQSVTLTLEDEIDVARGDVICAADAPAQMADQIEATIVWMHDDEMLPGRPYLIKIGARTVVGAISVLSGLIHVDTLEHTTAKTLKHNEIGICKLTLYESIAFDSYADNGEMGSFILIDRESQATVGAGLIRSGLQRSQNVRWQPIGIHKVARAEQKGQKPCVIWLTGLSGAGKSTIANVLESKLFAEGRHSYLLDGDNVRHGLCRDLGFTAGDRVENIRRIAETARLMADAGLIAIVACISPFRAERRMARELIDAGEFIEVFVDTPLDVAEARDPKGLYRKARQGILKDFTGIDSPYEEPENPEVHVETTAVTPEEAAELILRHLRAIGTLRQ